MQEYSIVSDIPTIYLALQEVSEMWSWNLKPDTIESIIESSETTYSTWASGPVL